MSDVAVKAKRRWIILPWAAVIAAVVAWSAWWMIASHQIVARMDAQAQTLRTAGWSVVWQNRSVSGYPFRFFIQMDQVHVSDPAGWGLAAPKLDAETSAITPSVIVFVAKNGLVLSRPGKPGIAIMGDVLRMSLGGLKSHPPRISVEGINLKLSPSVGERITFSAISRFEAHLRLEAGDTAKVFFRIDQATPSTGTLLSRLAETKPVTVDVEGAVTNASQLNGGAWNGLMSRWGEAGGQLRIEQGGISLGNGALLSLKASTLSVDEQGFLKGSLSLHATQVDDAMMALSDISVLPQQTASVASGMAAGQSLLAAIGGIKTTLHFHDAQAWLGPVALGDAPRIYRVAEAPAAQ